MSFEVQAAVYGIVIPAVVSLTALVGLRAAIRSLFEQEFASDAVAMPVAVVAGFAAAYLLFPWTTLLPANNWNWLLYLGAVAAGFGVLGYATNVSRGERLSWLAVLAVVAGWFLVPGWTEFHKQRLIEIAAIAGVVFAACVLWEFIAQRMRGAASAWLLVLTAATAAMVLERSGNMKFAQLAGALAASLAGVAIFVNWKRTERLPPSSMAVVATLLVGLLYCGQAASFSKVPLIAYVLPAAAPALLMLATVGSFVELTGFRRGLLQVFLIVVPLSIALYLAGASDYFDMLRSTQP